MKWKAKKYKNTVCCAMLVLVSAVVFGRGPASAGAVVSDVESHHVDIWSDGTRISGDVFYPPGSNSGDKLPAIILCNGWGGVRSHLNKAYAPQFAAAGYVVLSFDYRGWGDSDSRLEDKGYKTMVSGHSMKLGAGHYKDPIAAGDLPDGPINDALIAALNTPEMDRMSLRTRQSSPTDSKAICLPLYAGQPFH